MFIFERRIKESEVTLPNGKKVKFGSKYHLADIERQLSDMVNLRNRYRRGSDARANCSRVISKLRSELGQAKKYGSDINSPSPLSEGGAVGHLYHLYDNPELTFGDMKNILSSAFEGTLEKATEKLDGMNLVFSWSSSTGLRVARNAGEIKAGGLDSDSLYKKFENRERVQEAFGKAFDILNRALSSLSSKTLLHIFGEEGKNWFSMEIIYSKNPNVIRYDSNYVVFHEWPTFTVDDSGNVTKGASSGTEKIVPYLESMQTAIADSDWRVLGPALLSLKKMANKKVLNDALSEIDNQISSFGLDDSSTIQDYLYSVVLSDAKKNGVDIPELVAQRIVGMENAPSLNDLKKRVPKENVAKIQSYVKSENLILKHAVAPIEKAIHDFAVQFLSGISSTLIKNPDEEISRLRDELEISIEKIKSSGDESSMEVLKKQLMKLGNYDDVISSLEGVVFLYKGQAYKFTGAFAPLNQILGIFRYSKQRSTKNENLLRRYVGLVVCDFLGKN